MSILRHFNKHHGYDAHGKRTPFFGGGGGGGPTSTQSTGTTYNTNIPEYAQPYVETMLGATQKQLFDMSGNEITGFKPYQPYSKNASDYVAGFSPLQQQAMQATGQLGVPNQYGQATQMTRQAGMGSLGLAGQMAGAGQQYAQQAQDPNSIAGYMSPYMQNVVNYQKTQALRDYGIGQGLRKAQSVGQGAFGGNRAALMESEAQRALGSQIGGIEAQGAQQAFQNAQQAQQYGANLGLQGQQAALGGLGQYGQMAGQLGQLGGQQLKAQQDVIQAKYGMGQQQQAAEQQKINQAIQDWANTQQYPLMQLGVMSNMLRGLPMQASTTNQYVAAPNALTQGIGAAGAGASLYNALRGASGGLPKEFKPSKTGIKSYYEGELIESTKSDLYDLPLDELDKRAKNSPSPTIKRLATAIAKEKRMGLNLAGGGIIAFQNRGLVPGIENVPEADRGNELLKEYLETNPRTPANVESKLPRSYNEAKSIPVDVKEPGQDIRDLRSAFTNFKLPDAPSSLERSIKVAKQPKAEAPVEAPAEIPPPSNAPTVNPASIVAARPREDYRSEPAAGPTQAQRDAFYIKNQNVDATQQPKVGVPGQGNLSAAPSDKIMPTAGIKLPRGLEEPSADPYANMTTDEIAAKKLAFLGGDVRKEERAGLMAERASAKDEARRAQSMRMAEFFAAWGSTPGSTITAGLSALKTKLPDIITDSREEAKIRRAINKDIAALDKADRLEKSGAWDEAAKIKQDQAKNAYNIWGKKVDYLSARQSDESRERAASVRAEGGGGGTEKRYIDAVKNLEKVETDIATERNKDEYTNLKRTANRDPSGKSATMQKSIADAKTAIAKIDEGFENRRKLAKDTVTRYSGEVGLGPKASSEAPASSAGTLVKNKDGTLTYQR